VDVLETEDEVLVLADMPGVKPDEVDVRFEKGELTIHGRRAAGHADRESHLREYEATNYFGQKTGNRTQAGATFGGPAKKNRAFFFVGYEALRTQQDKSLFASVPNPAFVGGNFSSLATPIVDPRTGLLCRPRAR